MLIFILVPAGFIVFVCSIGTIKMATFNSRATPSTRGREWTRGCGSMPAGRGVGGIMRTTIAEPLSIQYGSTPNNNTKDNTSQQCVAICQLQPHLSNTVVIGLVIGKQSVHSFPDKKKPGGNRYKMSFTIRDTPTDYINVTCWGSESYISGLSDSFRIHDVVEVQNCQVSSKPGGEADDKWSPWTPSPFQLTVNEMYSSVGVYTGSNYVQLSSLAHVPIRPHDDYYTLTDILANGQSLDGSYLNLLAVVASLQKVESPKQMTSKTGKPLKKCEVILLEERCNQFSLFIWDSELIDLAQTWIPKENIIFAVDVKVTFNTYKNAMIGTCTSKTLITTNPDCAQAHSLYQYAQSVEVDSLISKSIQGEGLSSGDTKDLQTITDIYTVAQIIQLKGSGNIGDFTKSFGPFYGIVFAYLTLLDIDQDPFAATSQRCLACKFRVPQDSSTCCNQSCSSQMSSEFLTELIFDLTISLSDHTDTIEHVRLSGQPAIQLFTTTPTEFLSMSEQQRIELKSSLLLEKFKVYFKCTTFGDQQKSWVRVLNIEAANSKDILSSFH